MIRTLRHSAFALVILALARVSLSVPITYTANLNGPSESPPNASPGIGFAQVDYDLAAHFMHVHTTFSGLLGPTTASHVHAPTAVPFTGTAGVATQVPTFSGFPLGVTSGTYDMSFDTSLASTWNPAYITANGGSIPATEAAFGLALSNGTAYYNIHTQTFPSGEIRGFLAIPEPASIALLLPGAIGALARRRRPA